MGWFMGDDFVDDGYHEGFIVGLFEGRPGGRPGDRGWHEIAPDPLAVDGGGPGKVVPVRRFQVACECGWRSRRFVAPAGAEWFPSYVELRNDTIEVAASSIWRRHVEAERAEQRAGSRIPTPSP